MRGKKEMYPYRIFICYSHKDKLLAKKLAEILERKGLNPLWDQNIRPGTAFADEIKGMITHSHIFMPLITKHSMERPWVHQETGYAMALNIPVLPIAIGKHPEEMIAHLHAISVNRELDELSKILDGINWDRLVMPPAAKPMVMHEIARYPEKRAELMSEYANRIIDLGHYGRVKQRAAFTSFSIPDAIIGDPIWQFVHSGGSKSDYFNELLREERIALERHARVEGCDLIMDPYILPDKMIPKTRITRLNILLNFLDSIEDSQIDIVCIDKFMDANITIICDWFLAESRAVRLSSGWKQTIFSWHTPTVLQGIQQFDSMFEKLLKNMKWERGKTRKKAIAEIRKVIKSVEVKP